MNHWKGGLLLAMATAVLWATLPIAAKLALSGVDAFTLTWARFAFAAVVTATLLVLRSRLGAYRDATGDTWRWLGLASLALVGNYLLYLVGLERTTPGNAQLLIQTAPLMMGLGGVVVFRERLTARQWAGVAVLLAGMGLFSSDQLLALASEARRYLLGTAIILLSATSWAVYALVQKGLAKRVDSQQVLGVVYVVGTVLLLPVADLGALWQVRGDAAWAVFYCCLNTVLAYGAFGASVERWDSARVSAVLTLTPLGTLGLVALLSSLGSDWVEPERVTALGWLGALAVVAGSMTVSLSKR